MRTNKTEEVVFLNGKFIAHDAAKLPVLTPGFLYGWGLFESMRSYKNSIVYFKAHMERLKKSAVLLDIKCPYTTDELREIIRKAVQENAETDAYVRLTLWKAGRGASVLVTAQKYNPYPPQKYKRGLRACVSSFRQNEFSYLAQIKSTNYLLFRLAYAQAIKRGFEEAIILNHRGNIAEASRSNLFFVKNKELFTPALESSCLDGITRRAVLDLAKKYNIKVYEGSFSLPDLYASDQAFLTNSLMGIMPLASVEGRRIGKSAGFSALSRFFAEEYKTLLENGT